jgi:alkanesulfonate monooxygenase SsuD/methylene tetrahydromethanopterin reductase-like flavin-dependent oxidoreductase (luciferase family)
VTYRGKHFDVESARVWDLPDTAPPIGIAVSGAGSCRLARRHADAMIATARRAELGRMFDDVGGAGKPRIGQIAVSYDPDQQLAVRRAMEQFRWFTAAGASTPSAGTPKRHSSGGRQPSCCRPSERHDRASRAGQPGWGSAAGRVAQFGTPSPLAGS